jgi:DHA1 family tetracycline resistance protein-like MFS transporter
VFKNKSLLTIFIIIFVDLLGFGLILPLLPYIGEKYGANEFQIGILGATYSLFQFISSPILGRLSDRFGRKKLLILSQIGSVFGYCLLAFSNSLPLIFLSRIIDGTTGGNISIAQAYIADVTDEKNRARGMGLIGAAFGLGFIFGPITGGLLTGFGFWAPALFAATVGLITVFLTITRLEESVDIKKSSFSKRSSFSFAKLVTLMKSYPIGLLIFTFFLLNTAFSVMQGNFALWIERAFGFGATQSSFYFTYIGILSVIVQLRLLPMIINKYHESNIIKYATFVMMIGFFILPFMNLPLLLLIPLTLFPISNGLVNPAIQAFASEHVKKEDYGGTLGLLQSFGSLGRIVGPVMGGWIFYVFGKDASFFLSGCILLVLSVYLFRKLKTV